MRIEFDPDKDEANRRKHGLPLAFGERVLSDPGMLEMLDDTMDYGEDRFLGLGNVGGTIYAIVYTERPAAIRMISVRRAEKREHDRYFTRD